MKENFEFIEDNNKFKNRRKNEMFKFNRENIKSLRELKKN